MATQRWDSAQNIRSTAEWIDSFIYVEGKTSPKIRKVKEHTVEEYHEFLNMIRENLWTEYDDTMKDMGWR